MNKQEINKMKSRLLQKPPIVNPDKPIILYHGTSLSNFEKIKTQGIKPRGKKESNWKEIGISRPDLVYLTNCYACYYALSAVKKDNDKQVVIKIKIDPKKIKLYLDEEFIYHALEYNKADNRTMAKDLYNTINPKNLTSLIKDRFKRKITWVDSLNFMGTVSCDFVPVENIISYTILDSTGFLYCDPSISPLNYKILAREYISQLEKLKYIPFKKL